MRLGLNTKQWEKLCDNTDKISSFPVTIGEYLAYFTQEKERGNFNVAYSHKSKTYGVWYDDVLDKKESEELIDAMFDLFCSMEEI